MNSIIDDNFVFITKVCIKDFENEYQAHTIKPVNSQTFKYDVAFYFGKLCLNFVGTVVV